jgi:hypothetical protein
VPHILPFSLFENSVPELSVEQKKFLNQRVRGEWTFEDGLVNVIGDVSLRVLGGFSGVKFGKVDGDFFCNSGALTSLEGSPHEVTGNFQCVGNKLANLKGGPLKVGKEFICSENKLLSLEGAPEEVGYYFGCQENELRDLRGAPKFVGGDFSCRENGLTSLEGAPHHIAGNFYCQNNELVNLEGAPKEVGGMFNCSENPLSSFDGAPEKIGGYFKFGDLQMRWNTNYILDQLLRSKSDKYSTPILIHILGNPEKFTPQKIEEFVRRSGNSFAITSELRKRFPQVWSKIQGTTRSDLSADLGDLFF